MVEGSGAASCMTYRELLDRLVDHRLWIEEQGNPTGPGSRFAGLYNAVDLVDEAYRKRLPTSAIARPLQPSSRGGRVESGSR